MLIAIGVLIIWPTKTGGSSAPTPTVTVTETATVEPESEDPRAADDPDPDGETNESGPEPESDRVAFDIYDVEGTVTAEFNIRDSLTKGLIRSNAKDDTIKAIQEAVNEYPDYSQIVVIGWFPTVDNYGNEKDSTILIANYSRETIEKINFDNSANIDIFKIRDSGVIHPDLLD